MSGKNKFWLITIIYLLLMLTDGALTYAATPDLTNEANPLVARFGFGWAALFLANAVGFALFVGFVYHAFVRYNTFERPVIECNGFRQYLSMLMFGRPDKFIWTFIKFPDRSNRFAGAYLCAVAGYAFAAVLPAMRFVIVLEWLGHMRYNTVGWDLYYSTDNFYRLYNDNIRGALPLERFDLWAGLLITCAVIAIFLSNEYKRNKNALEKAKFSAEF